MKAWEGCIELNPLHPSSQDNISDVGIRVR